MGLPLRPIVLELSCLKAEKMIKKVPIITKDYRICAADSNERLRDELGVTKSQVSERKGDSKAAKWYGSYPFI